MFSKVLRNPVLPLCVLFSLITLGCPDDTEPPEPTPVGVANDIFAPMGEVLPSATAEQRATFARGLEVMTRRFRPSEGLGPQFNVTFCGACHERPVFGGSAGHYRDFILIGETLNDGTFLSVGTDVIAHYGTGDESPRPGTPEDANTFAPRNPIAFFGVGLIAELPDAAILANADPTDADGDGISGRPNYDQGFVGRFGRKAQTVSLEGFIRGPLNNHLGVTTNPLTDESLARLPVPSSLSPDDPRLVGVEQGLVTVQQPQVAAPAEPLTDLDEIPDPEMGETDLFDLVSTVMLMAAPQPEALTPDGERGRTLFNELACSACHVSMLVGPRGGIPLYSDLLLHDMGDELGDGIVQGLASGNEFRTQPLWGSAAVGPYLHDGRADTIDDAVRWHGGEAETSREAYVALPDADQRAVVEFLNSLGGRDQVTTGLLLPEAPIPDVGEPGGPFRELSVDEQTLWLAGRELFDRDFGIGAGIGPHFNGDSCRGCHFDPVIGGAGPLDVNVMRHGTWEDGTETNFVAPTYGTILTKLSTPFVRRREQSAAHNVFEPRQTPPAFGLGLVETIPDEVILALADPDDLDGDGVRGVAHILSTGQLGRLGWKAQVPSLREFVRDAMSAEMGITIPAEEGFTFGATSDDDEATDPELTTDEIDSMTFYLQNLGPLEPVATNTAGRGLFEQVECGACHVPELMGADGPVALYSDLLLHDVAADGNVGIPDGSATQDQFRTPPLWGLSQTGPYMHDGASETVRDAIEAHLGESDASREAFEALTDAEQNDLIEFLEGL